MSHIYQDPLHLIQLSNQSVTLIGKNIEKADIELVVEDVTVNDQYIVQKIEFKVFPKQKTTMKKVALDFDVFYQIPDANVKATQNFHWIPNIKFEKEDVCSDHSFRSPACITTLDSNCVAMIPDVKFLKDHHRVPHFMDMCFDENVVLTYGCMPHKPYKHVYYKGTQEDFTVYKDGLGFHVYIMVSKNMDHQTFLHQVDAFLWETYASEYMRKRLPQQVPFDQYARYGHAMALRYLWQKGDNNEEGGIILSTFQDQDGIYGGREYKNDVWFHAWFNNMRTAYGLYEFGKRNDRSEWIEKSIKIGNLLVSSPQQEGIFPTIFAPLNGGWIPSSQHGGGPDVYSLPDCAWTAIWLRYFMKDCHPIKGGEAFLKNFRNFLYQKQDPQGGLPCWVDKKTLQAKDRLNNTASEALSYWFLALEYEKDFLDEEEKEKVWDVLEKGVHHIIENTIKKQRFEDFELYYSCSKKPLDYYDKNTELYGQNTLAIQWCAEFLHTMYRIQGNKNILEHALFCVDLLSLYQQVWDPPFLNTYAFGGFGVMNTDGEWNDARQAQFAHTLALFYETTGNFMYLERAVAALRAGFALMVMKENESICPNNYLGTSVFFEVHGNSAENYGHGGFDQRNYNSGYHWGIGSSLTTAAWMKKTYKDVLVDVKAKKAVGIDGIAIKRIIFKEESIKIEIEKLSEVKIFEVMIKNHQDKEYHIEIDGHTFVKKCEKNTYIMKEREA